MDNLRRIEIATMSSPDLVSVITCGTPLERDWAGTCLKAKAVDDDDNDAAIDAWNDGWFAGLKGRPMTEVNDPNYVMGWAHGHNAPRIRPWIKLVPEIHRDF